MEEEKPPGSAGPDLDAEQEEQLKGEGELAKKDAAPELYDPVLDDKDEAWVTRKRQGRKSDAVLSCPSCFTTLCIDCQRHELYVNQYRAMFVLNCRVVESEILRSIPNRKRQKQVSRKANRRARGGEEVENSGRDEVEETYKPVRCEECDAQVAVLDHDEVYHFVNVLPSYS